MTITDIVRKGKGKAGSGGAWRVESQTVETPAGTFTHFTLWHYSTPMLVWDDTKSVLYYGTGHGSKSDQNGMNQAFRVLGSSLYYSRAGGADIR